MMRIRAMDHSLRTISYGAFWLECNMAKGEIKVKLHFGLG